MVNILHKLQQTSVYKNKLKIPKILYKSVLGIYDLYNLDLKNLGFEVLN
jgi:hypothetical protein